MEFLFALSAVFGSTGVLMVWQWFIYNLEKPKEKKQKPYNKNSQQHAK